MGYWIFGVFSKMAGIGFGEGCGWGFTFGFEVHLAFVARRAGSYFSHVGDESSRVGWWIEGECLKTEGFGFLVLVKVTFWTR